MTTIKITDSTLDRYQAIAMSSVWKLETVRGATALVVGAGALGNEVTKNLAMMGIHSIVIVDRDRVEVANLTRSIFFRERDHGQSKAEILAERLIEFNPDVSVLSIVGDVEEVLGLGLVRRMGMIFSCLDNRLARRSLNRMCQKIGKPWVDGAMENLQGEVSVFLPDEGPCYECGLSAIDKELIRQTIQCKGIAIQNLSQGKTPTISTMGSIIGALQVQEGVKLLHGQMNESLAGKRLVVNCLINDFYTTQVERKPGCDGHFRYGEIIEVPEWTVEATTAIDILERFKRDTGHKAHLRLGRDVVVGLSCEKCETREELVEPLHMLSIEKAACHICGDIRVPNTTNVIKGDELYARWPLEMLRIPPLEILEVKSGHGQAWYEMTGDAQALSVSLSV